MRGTIAIFSVLLIFAGIGQMLTAPADDGQTAAAPWATHNYADPAPVGQLAALTRPTGAGGCPSGLCPLQRVKEREVKKTVTTTVSDEGNSQGRQRIVATTVAGVLKRGAGILGRDRRVARRENRRDR